MNHKLERILPTVQKPARYTGGEYNAADKSGEDVDVRFALCFPDTYEIGMSNLGLRILYGVLNELPGVWCQRAFAPWADMEAAMRAADIPLYGLESGDPIREFDILGFSLGYEMAYTNVLNLLDLAGLPVRAEDRGEDGPLVLAGGVCTFNPEPLADFIDLFFVGEGEDAVTELVQLYRAVRAGGGGKAELLRRAAELEGFYVPTLYDITYGDDGTITAITPKSGAAYPVSKRLVRDFDKSYFPTKTMIPSTEVVHDRVMLELFRGCIRGCRFCQAGFVCRPVRAREMETLAAQGIEALQDSGYQELTLSSLSSSDYRPIEQLCDALLPWCGAHNVSIALPSLRADNFSMTLMSKLQHGRKSSLTFAPEAGTQRLRDAINKNVTEENLLETCKTAFSGGWSAIKLYFMLGLPTETDEDVLGIADLARKVFGVWREFAENKRRGVRITVSTSCFVPKPHTPFQWEAQVTMEEYRRRVELLRGALKAERSVSYNWHDAETSRMEAVLSRGDRRLGAVLERAWRDGCKLDAWSEYFDYSRWIAAFSACGIDPDFYAARARDKDEILPWSVTTAGVRPEYLWRERAQCYAAAITPDCHRQCTACGANCLIEGGVCDV